MLNLFLCAVDITVCHNGFHGDLNETFFVGEVDDASKMLVQTAYECMMKGIAIGEFTDVGFWLLDTNVVFILLLNINFISW